MKKKRRKLKTWVVFLLSASVSFPCGLYCSHYFNKPSHIWPLSSALRHYARLPQAGNGLIAEEKEPEKPTEEELPAEYVFDKADFVMYSLADRALRAEPYVEAEKLLLMPAGTEVHVTGTNSLRFWRVEADGKTGYTDFENLVPTKELTEEKSLSKTMAQTTWNGDVLNPIIGTIEGPSGKETYYNLPMEGVVANSHADGISGSYWVRDDGVKMLGDYILCACDVSGLVHDRYDIVETSLGYGICSDTGTFVEENPYQIDIATDW